MEKTFGYTGHENLKMVWYMATEYTFGIGGKNRTIVVKWKGDDKWAITDGYAVYNRSSGEWEYEPSPSSKEDDLSNIRYSLDEALEVATKLYKEEVGNL